MKITTMDTYLDTKADLVDSGEYVGVMHIADNIK